MNESERFWFKVDKRSSNECWNWTASINRWGYGKFWWDKNEIGAHRFSWILHNGDIPPEVLVLHKCNNPACVNPAHLYLGDQSDNLMDRTNSGYVHDLSIQRKLSSDDIKEIRDLLLKGTFQRVIANKFNVSQATISNVVRGKYEPRNISKHDGLERY